MTRIFEKRAIWSTPALVRESEAKIIPARGHGHAVGHRSARGQKRDFTQSAGAASEPHPDASHRDEERG
jgi:hypothetical protein